MTRRDISSLVSYKGRPSDGDGWNKVKLLNASRHDKTEVLRALVNSYKELQPLSFQKQGMNYVFYVETRAQVCNKTELGLSSGHLDEQRKQWTVEQTVGGTPVREPPLGGGSPETCAFTHNVNLLFRFL